jgi:predicted dinucleotide-binding enzyme
VIQALKGNIVIDATNRCRPISRSNWDLMIPPAKPSRCSRKARVVKAFNTTGAEIMAKAKDFPNKPVMFVAGDGDGAKKTVHKLADDIGVEAIDAGPLSRYLERCNGSTLPIAESASNSFSLVRR